MEWWETGTVDQEAMCARCYIRIRRLPDGQKLLKCKDCGNEKPLREFTSVAIRHWVQQDRHNNVATCYDCHYPPCAMPWCGKRPAHAVVKNSWVAKADFIRQLVGESCVVDDIYGCATKQWFCGSCKYPPCAKQAAANCVRTRNAKSKLRFQSWTCKPCQQLEEFCSECERACLADRSFHEQLSRLESSISELGRLPRRGESEHVQAGTFIHHCRGDRDKLCALKKRALENLPHWTWRADGTAALDAAWWGQLAAVESYLAQHGRLPKQSSALGQWVNNVRKPERRRRLSPEQLGALKRCKIIAMDED